MLRGLLLILCALALTAPAAVAQNDEIFVDPGSPSGKEYALPVESARRQASRDGQKRSSTARPAPPFGEGVDDGSTAGQRGATSGTGDAKSGGGGGGGGATGDDADGGAPSAQGAARTATLKAQAASPDGGIGLAAVIGVGAGVLVLGGAIGMLLRRRSARDA